MVDVLQAALGHKCISFSQQPSRGPRCLISLHWGTEAQGGKGTLLQAHEEGTLVPGSWGRAGALESGEPCFMTQLLCDLESQSLGFLIHNKHEGGNLGGPL